MTQIRMVAAAVFCMMGVALSEAKGCAAGLAQQTPAGQRIVGTIHEAASGVPVPGAVVSILDSTGRARGRTISDERGRYRVLRPSQSVQMRVVRIGFGPITIALPATSHDTTIDLTMTQRAVALEEVRVSGKTLCSASGDRGEALDLWDQARSALLATIVAHDAKPAKMSTLMYDRVTGPRDDRIIQQHLDVKVGTSSRPFVAARPPAQLATQGYMRGTGTDEEYFAPDADVMFDDSFADAHCFRAEIGAKDHGGQIGLSFTPRRSGDAVVDVRGVLWVDSKNQALVQLEYSYTGVNRVAAQAGAGGTLHFRSMPNGVSFIDEWRILLPVLRPRVSKLTSGDSVYVAQLAESGGIVVAAEWADGTRWIGHNAGMIRGQVREMASHHSLSDVMVGIVGGGTTVTANDGRFAFGPLPKGRYNVEVTDSTFGQFLPSRSTGREVIVRSGDTVDVTLEVESRGAIVNGLCKNERTPGEAAVLLGHVGDGTGKVPSDLRISATWQSDYGMSPSTIVVNAGSALSDVDDGGRFHVCGVTRDRSIVLRALIGKNTVADTTIRPGGDAARFVEWMLPSTAFSSAADEASAFTGRVLTQSDHKPVANADVWMPSGDVHARTDSMGQFRLYGLPPGKQFVEVKRIGFTELRDTVTLRGGREVTRDFSLDGSLVTLDTMRTTSPIVAYHKPMLQQFEMRRHTGVGRYIPEEVLRKNDNLSVSLFLAGRIGGIKFVGYKSMLFAASIRNTPFLPRVLLYALERDKHSPQGCWVSVYIDGAPLYTGPGTGDAPDFSIMRVEDYAGVEFYAGGASTPAQFNITKEANCGVLLLWTRER